jgi:hypothetical protein
MVGEIFGGISEKPMSLDTLTPRRSGPLKASSYRGRTHINERTSTSIVVMAGQIEPY